MALMHTILLLLTIASPFMVIATWPVGLEELKEFLSRKNLFSAVALGNYGISSNAPTECEEIRKNHYSVKMEAKAKITELNMKEVEVTVDFYVFVCTTLSLTYDNVQGDKFAIYYVGDLHCPQYHLRHAMLSKMKNEINADTEFSFGGTNIPESSLMENTNLAAKIQDNWAYELLETFNLKSKNVKFTASSYKISKPGEEPEYLGAMFKESKIGMNKESIKFISYDLNPTKMQISNKYGIVPYIPEWTSHTPGTENPTTAAYLRSSFTYRFAKPIISFNVVTKTRMPAISLYSELWILEIEYKNDKEISKHCFVATLPKDIETLPPILGEHVVGENVPNHSLAGGNYTANAIMDFDQIDTDFHPNIKAEIWTSINALLFIRFEVPGESFEYTFTGISGTLSTNASLKEFVWIFELQKVPSDSIRAKYFGVLVRLCNHTKVLSAVAIGHFSRSIVTIRSTPRRNFFSKGLHFVEGFGAKLIFSQEEPSNGLIGEYLKKLKRNTESGWDTFKETMQRHFPNANFDSIPFRPCYGTFLANCKAKMSEFIVFEVLQNDGLKLYFIMELLPNEGGYRRLIRRDVFRTSEEAEDYTSEQALPSAPTFGNV